MLTKKRWISLCLTVALLLCCFVALPMDAQAESGTCGENLTWTLSNGTLTISGTGDMYDYTGSSHAPWFSKRSSVTEIKIDRGVTHIGDYAFRNCEITSLTIPGNVKSIGQYAFRTNQSLQHVVLEEGVESLGKYAFAYCSSLATIKLTSSVKLLAERAVFDCPVLTDVYYVGTQDQWNAMTIETGNHKFTGVIRSMSTDRGTCGDNLNWDLINGILTISGTGDMYDYNESHAPWFNHRGSIKKIKIGEDVTSIGDRAFRNCAITEITIPGNVKTIGQYAFRTCDSLKTVTLEDGVQTIEANAFTWCDTLETVNIPASVTSIEEKAFFDCPMLADVYYPSSQQQWDQIQIGSGNDDFLNASHHIIAGMCGENLNWSISGNVLTISGKGEMYDYSEGGAPWYCERKNITAINLSSGMTTIGNYAFEGCAFTEVSTPKTVSSIGTAAFKDCDSLTEVVINEGAESIGESAFDSCDELSSVKFRWTVTAIGQNAFRGCENLKEVTYVGVREGREAMSIGSGNECLEGIEWEYLVSGQCGDNLYWAIYGKYLVIYGTGDMYNYKERNGAPWASYSNDFSEIWFLEGVTSIGDYAFRSCSSNAYDIILPAGIKRIGSYAFPVLYGAGFDLAFSSVPPEIADDAFAGVSGLEVYAPGWPESACKSYGTAKIYWQIGELGLSEDQNLCFDLNEEITADKLQIVARYSDRSPVAYTAKNLTIGVYDNSTYGQKTVEIIADGHVIPMTYYVSDGQTHFEQIQVSFNQTPKSSTGDVNVVVTAGDITLVKDKDYTVSITSFGVGKENTLTITGIGNFEGFRRQYHFAAIKDELDNTACDLNDKYFTGLPQDTHGTVYEGGRLVVDYKIIAENNVNIGSAKARVIGVGSYCGSIVTNFSIMQPIGKSTPLPGKYIGQADGEMTGEYYYSENIIEPCKYKFNPACDSNWVAQSFRLYRVYGEDYVELIDSYDRIQGMSGYAYDFTHVYEDALGEGIRVYVLEYAWGYSSGAIYAGAVALGVPGKVADAQTMYVEELPNDGDFRRSYFEALSEDGNLGFIDWSVSNSRVATMDDGVLTFLKPGTVTVTGSNGKISASKTVTMETQMLNNGILLRSNTATNKAVVVYDGFVLEEGKDYYIMSAEEKDGVVELTVIGQGLFAGVLMRRFDAKTNEVLTHTHVFSAVCDPSCESCDFVRESVHTLTPGWKRDAEGHWHVCKLCGEQQDYEAHTFTDPDTCGVCGGLNLPGDMNDDYEVTDADAVYLLRHTLFGDSYPITRNGDFNNDGAVTDADAVYLLRHTLFGDSYPIQ